MFKTNCNYLQSCFCSFRYVFAPNMWQKIFHELLNIPSCDELPDLGQFRKLLEDEFIKTVNLERLKDHLEVFVTDMS